MPILLQRRAQASVRGHSYRLIRRIAVLLAGDIGSLVLASFVLHGIRDGGWIGAAAQQIARYVLPRGSLHVSELICAALVALAVVGAYRPGDWRRAPSRIMRAAFLAGAFVCWRAVWSDPSLRSAAQLITVCIAIGSSLITERLVVDAMVSSIRGELGGSILLIGSSTDAEETIQRGLLSKHLESEILGYVDASPMPGGAALGGIADLGGLVEQLRPDAVIFIGWIDDHSLRRALEILDAAACSVSFLALPLASEDVEARVIWHDGLPLLQITRPDLKGTQLFAKRCIDLLAASAALVLLLPVLLAIGAVVRATSRGPVLFRQRRVGVGGELFWIYKFRTMVQDAEEQRELLASHSIYSDARLFKIAKDPRLTRVGAFLRRTSLDELPQLWNVLRGDMSLVGPRPPVPSEVDLYEERHFTRFAMRPGITGPWQVNGRNRITDFEEVVRLETEYMRRWSIRKDLQILFRTVPAVLRMDGAH